VPNLRELAVADAKTLNVRDWGLKVEFTDPDGNRYITDNETGEELRAMQILYDYRKINPDTGEEIIVNDPVVVMARLSLARIPEAGERWHIRMPADPSTAASLEDFVLTSTRSPEGGRSLGFIRFYPQKVKQS
jgi:hypothetical protein